MFQKDAACCINDQIVLVRYHKVSASRVQLCST
jgi:hypothetical protein